MHNAALVALLVVAVTWGIMEDHRTTPATPDALAKAARKAELQRLIREEAERQGVPPSIALAFAEVESQFDPYAQGDRDWHLRKGSALYRKHVLESERFALNPWRDTPELWHSYGLFQLAAAHHTLALEDPRALLDPRTNILRGVGFIRTLLVKHNDDPIAARLAYTGNPKNETVREDIARRLVAALDSWGTHDQA